MGFYFLPYHLNNYGWKIWTTRVKYLLGSHQGFQVGSRVGSQMGSQVGFWNRIPSGILGGMGRIPGGILLSTISFESLGLGNLDNPCKIFVGIPQGFRGGIQSGIPDGIPGGVFELGTKWDKDRWDSEWNSRWDLRWDCGTGSHVGAQVG